MSIEEKFATRLPNEPAEAASLTNFITHGPMNFDGLFHFKETIIPPRAELNRGCVMSMMDWETPVAETFSQDGVENTFVFIRSVPMPLTYFMFFLAAHLCEKQAIGKYIERFPHAKHQRHIFVHEAKHHAYLEALMDEAVLSKFMLARTAKSRDFLFQEVFRLIGFYFDQNYPDLASRSFMWQEYVRNLENRVRACQEFPKVLTGPAIQPRPLDPKRQAIRHRGVPVSLLDELAVWEPTVRPEGPFGTDLDPSPF
jgi:hypothetical protein